MQQPAKTLTVCVVLVCTEAMETADRAEVTSASLSVSIGQGITVAAAVMTTAGNADAALAEVLDRVVPVAPTSRWAAMVEEAPFAVSILLFFLFLKGEEEGGRGRGLSGGRRRGAVGADVRLAGSRQHMTAMMDKAPPAVNVLLFGYWGAGGGGGVEMRPDSRRLSGLWWGGGGGGFCERAER